MTHALGESSLARNQSSTSAINVPMLMDGELSASGWHNIALEMPCLPWQFSRMDREMTE